MGLPATSAGRAANVLAGLEESAGFAVGGSAAEKGRFYRRRRLLAYGGLLRRRFVLDHLGKRAALCFWLVTLPFLDGLPLGRGAIQISVTESRKHSSFF